MFDYNYKTDRIVCQQIKDGETQSRWNGWSVRWCESTKTWQPLQSRDEHRMSVGQLRGIAIELVEQDLKRFQ